MNTHLRPTSGEAVASTSPCARLPSKDERMTQDRGVVIGNDGLARPAWAVRDPLLRDYYDTERGMPVTDERGVYERISLEGFGPVLGDHPPQTPRLPRGIRRLHPGHDRPLHRGRRRTADGRCRDRPQRRKIEATVANARATVALRDEMGLAALVWSFRPEDTPRPIRFDEIPTKSTESTALSKELRRRGFAFVGPTTMYALMEAIGIVDTHLLDSHRRGSQGSGRMTALRA